MIADDDEDDIELLKAAVKECPVKVNVSVAKDGRALLTLFPPIQRLELITNRLKKGDSMAGRRLSGTDRQNRVGVSGLTT